MRFKIFSIFIFITVLFSLAVLISIKTNQEVKVKVKYNIVEDDPSVSSRIISSYILGNDLIIEYSSDAEPRIEGLSSERYRIDDEKIVVYNYNNGYFRLVFGKGSDVYEFGIVPSVKAQEPQHNVFFDKPIDWSALWYLVKDHIKWDLEWSLDGSIWTSVTSDLTIKTSLIKQDTYKITLIFDASQAGNYRLTFAVDARVRNYVTRLDKYQYELDYEGFSLVFDWSDVVKISGLVITHGLKEVEGNEYFWFRMRRDGVPKGAHVEIDPTVAFTTVSVTSVHTCPLDTHTFVIAYHDETNDDFSFQIYDTNGTQVLAETDVDTTSGGGMDLTSIGVSAFNSTTFVIGWFDREVGKVTFSVYNSAGTLLSGPIDADTWVGYYSLSVSVSSFNSTAFVIGWYDGIDYDATFAVYNSAGTLLSGPIDADTDVGASSYSVSVSCFNSTAFVIGWYDSTDYDATFAVYNSAGTNLTMPIGADTTAGASYSVSVSTLNSTYFVIGWYDSTDQDATFAVYDSAGALKTGPTDADTAVGAESYSVQVSALNSTAFVISWYDYTDFDLSFATYLSDGTAVATLTDIESWPTAANSPFKYQSPCSQESGTGIKICNDNWIIAYANTTTQAGWRSYNPNGTVWDGICPGPDETAPTYSNIGSNVTNNTAVNTGTPINISAQWNDSVGLSMYVNSSKINNTGSWTNDTTWKTFTTGNWSNFTVIFPSAQGSNITVKIYANNTFGNQNVTGTWFWWNVTPDTTPPTYSQNSTNSTLAGTPVEHRLKWTDNVGLSGYIFSMNNTGTWQNDTWVDWTYVSDNFTDETKISAKNNVYVNTTAGHVRLADTVSGWVSPTGHEAGSGWSNEAYAYDDNLLSYTTIYMDPYGWTPFLNLTIDAITSNSLRYYAEAHPPAQGSIDVDVYKDGAWVDVYEGTLPYYIEWTEKTFTEGSVTKARVRIELGTLHSTADFGEFDFWDYPSNLYYSTGLLYSTNLLYGTSVSSIDQFNYTVSSLPAQTTLDILFSQDNSTWYNSTGGSDWQSLSSGTNTIDLSGLSWSGANFYYKAAFNNTDDSTPKLDYIAVLFTPSTTQWSNVTKTVNSTVGALVQWCVYANDTSNNWNGTSCQNPFSYVTTDTTPPIITVQSPVNNTVYPNNTIWFNVTLNEAGNKCLVNISNTNQTLTNSSGNWNYLNYTLPNGTYWTRFFCNDTAGNMNSSVYINFTIDTTPPTYSQNSTNSTVAGTPVEFRLRWTDDVGLSKGVLSLDNCTGSFVNQTWQSLSGTNAWMNNTYAINTSVGCTIRWEVYANDTANHWNTSLEYSFITIDIPPKYFDSSTNSTEAGKPVEFRLRWTDNIGLSKFIFSFDNCTGSFVNATEGWQPMTGTGNWSNVTKTINSTINCTFQWRIYTNDTGNNWNASEIFSYLSTEPIPPQYFDNSTNSTLAGTSVEFRLRWTDNFGLSGHIFSYDNGENATDNSTVNQTTTVPNYPNKKSICRDSQSNIHVAWMYNTTTIRYAKSDDGKTWDVMNLKTGSNTLSEPSIDCNGNNIYVVFEDSTSDDLIFKNSSDNGNTWSEQTLLTSDTESPLVQARGNNIYVANRYSNVYDNWNFSTSSQDSSPRGVTFNGTYFWVVGLNNAKVYRYLANGTYDNWNFSTSSQDAFPHGITFNGTYFWVVGGETRKVYRYLANGTYDNWNFSTSSQTSEAYGVTLNDTYFWVTGGSGSSYANVYRYLANGTYDNWYFNIYTEDSSPRGVTFNGTYFWVVGSSGAVYRYLANGTYDNWYFSTGYQDSSPYDITFNGTYFWVVGLNTDKVYRYPNKSGGINLLKSTDKGNSWSNATTSLDDCVNPSMVVDGIGDSNDKIYMVAKDVSITDGDIYFANSSNAGVSWSSKTKIMTLPYDGSYGHSYTYYPSIAFNDNKIYVSSDYYESIENHRIYFTNSTDSGGSWSNQERIDTISQGFSTFSTAEYPSVTVDDKGNPWVFWDQTDIWGFGTYNTAVRPSGVTFNGTYFWVVDYVSDTVYRYLANGTYDNWNFSVNSQDTGPYGVTFNGTYFWVVGDSSDKVYRYLANGTYDNWNFSTSSQDTTPQGVTFNGTYFWVAGAANAKVYRYLANGTYDNWNFSTSSQDTYPTDATFNGTYFWVAGGSSFKVYRYLANGTYDNWNFSAGYEPYGLYFNGTYFWVCNYEEYMVKRYTAEGKIDRDYNIIYRKYNGTSWESPVWLTDDYNINQYVNTKYSFDNDKIEFVWMNGSSSPYGLLYGYIKPTGPFVNDTWQSMTGTGNWSNVTKVTPPFIGRLIKWKVYANDTSNNWNTSLEYSFITTDVTPPLWQNQGTNDTDNVIQQGEGISLTAQGKDDVALDYAWLWTNETGGAGKNYTGGTYGSPMDMQDARNVWKWSNFSWSNSSVAKGTVVGWRIYYNDTSGNENSTTVQTFQIDEPPKYFDNSTNSTQAGQPVEFRLRWTDNAGLSGYVFSWYNGANWTWTNNTADLESNTIQFKGATTYTCTNNGACSGLGSSACSACSGAGCSYFIFSCIGTLNCPAYGTQASCIACSSCLWSYSSGDTEANKTYTTYTNVLAGFLPRIVNITVTANVSIYNKTRSNGVNSNPDLWLEAYDGSAWVEVGNMSVTTTGNFSKSTTASSVLNGWTNPTNRQIRIKGRYIDANATTWDEINYTAVWVQVDINSQFLNDTLVSFGSDNFLDESKVASKWQTYVNTTAGHVRLADDPIIRVQDYCRGTTVGSSISVTMTSTPTAGNVEVAVIGTLHVDGVLASVTSITQSGVTWTQQVSKAAYNENIEIWLGVVNSGASTSITVNLNNTASGGGVADICEYSGVATSNFLDLTATNAGTSVYPDTGTTATTTQADELWIGGAISNAGSYQREPTDGFTLFDGLAYSYIYVGYLEKIVSSTGAAHSSTNTDAVAGDWKGCIATFKAATTKKTYWSTGLLYSTNLLYGTSVSSIDQFNYTVSSLPAQTTLDILFSQDNSTWYNSTGGSDWQSLSSGTNTIDLSGLSWSGANFYYKAAFNNTDDSTPKLDYIAVLFTPSTTQWSNVTKTVNSTVGALVQWCVYANDTSNNWNGSSCTNPFSYLTTSAADTTSPTYSNNQTQLITIYTSSGYSNFSITWTDNSGSANAYLENNFTGALTNTSMSGSYPNFYYNTTPLAARTYQFRFIANDSSNNQNSTDVQYFTINKAVLIMSLSGSNVTYPTAVNIIPSETNTVDTDVNYTFWRNSTLVSSALGSAPTADTSSLGAGWYVYKLNSSGGTNFTSNATGVSRNINVSKATPTISISGDNVTYPTSVSITTSETNSIDTDCTYTLYRNTATIGTGTPSDSSTLGVDSYTYVYNTSGCTNFTSGTTNRLIVVSKGTLAGSVSGSNVIYPTSMNEVAVESNIGDGDVAYYLYRDGVQVSTATGSAPSADTSTLGVGSYSYILNATGTFANWTQNASIATDTTTVNKGALSGSLSTPTVTYPTSLTATASESNNGDSDVAYRIYCDEILVASATGSAPSGSYQFGAGNHNCKFNTTGAAFGNWTTNASIATSTGTVNQGGINIDLYFNTTKNSDKTITYPEAVNVTGWINISSQNTFYLYENGTSRGSQVSQVIEYLQRYGNNTYNFTIYYPATENYSSFSRTNYLKINKATPTISLVTNCTWSGTTYETVCNQTGYVTTGDATATKKLYRDGVEKASDTPASEIIRLGYGNYNYNYTYFASENYTFNNATNTLVINKKNVNVQVYPTTQTKTYPDTTVTQYCTDDSSLLDCSIYRNGTSITNNTQYSPGVGVYVYKANITDIANYTNYEDTETLTVNPTSATLTLYLNSSSSNITVERNWAVNITAVANNAQGTIYLYNNSVLITSCSAAVCTNIEPHPANVGTEFNITAHYPATQNYSSATSASYYIKINNTIPSVPNLLTPTNNDYTADNTTTFDWSDSNDPNTEQSITYDLQIFYNNGTQRLLKSSLSSSTYTLSSGEALPDGVYKWRVRAYDSVNYSAWTSNYTLTIDTINPDITMYIPSPLNTTIVNSSIALNISCFNTNLKDVILNITNSTNYLLHSNSTFGLGQPTYWWTHTVDTSSWNEGNMTITINCSDYANNQRVESYIFTVDHYVPSISGLTTYPTSPTTYSPGQNYQFNATITDTGSGLSQIIFEFNGANYTDASHSGNVYYKTLTDLTANPSGYSYRWYANDSANQWSSSSIQSYVINKASPSISVAPLTSVTYGTATQTGCQRDSGDSSSTLTLYRNNSQVASDTTSPINESSIVLAAGTYNYTCTISETQNYTFGYSLNNYRTVDKAALTGSISILPSTTVTYPTETTSSYSETNIGDSDVTYKFYRDDMEKSSPEAITLGAGAYTYKLNTTAGSFQNYTANSSITTQILTVNQNTSNPVNLYLNGTLNSNRTYTYPEVVNATGAAVYTNSGTINLYRDGVNKSNPEIITLGNGTYAYKVNATGNANYSDNSTGITFYALINKGTPDVKTFIDELPSNKAVTYPTSVTIRGNSTTSIIPPTFNLYVGSVSLGSGNPVSQSVTMGAGTHNVVYNTPGNANWTSASNNTLYLIVQQNNTNPIDIYIDNGTVYKNQNVTITYGTQITANSTLIYSSSGTALLWRNDSSTTNPETVLLGAGTYTYKGNTSGNENYTSNQTVYYYVFVNKAPTSTNLLLNGTDGDRTYNYGQVANLTATVNASGETVRIDANFTSGYTTSGTTPLHNYTTLNYNPGTYNVTGYMQETTNYTASSETHYLYLYGWSKIEWTLPTGSVNRSILNLICKVTDKNTTSTISNYPVKFYNSTHYLGQSLTNSSGYANLSWDSRGVDVGEEAIKCNITDNSTLYYNASETYEASTTLTLMGTLNVTITSPTDGSNYYRGQTVSLQSDIKDENGVTIAGTTANWYNTTTNIYSGEDGTWTIPLSDSLLGSETILANATKTYYNNGESSVTITILNNLPIATTPAYNVTPAKIVRGEGIRITCNVTDTEDSAGQLSVNISIKNPNNVWNNITASNIGDTFYRDYQTTESSALGTYIAVCSALDTDSGRIENSSTFLVWQNATITIDLNASEYSWGVGVNVFGQASYTDAEYVSSSDTTVKVEGQTKCTTTTDSSGQYSCAFSAPESIGNFTLFVEITDVRTGKLLSNSTVLIVRTTYGEAATERTGAENVVCYEVPQIVQNPDGTIKRATVKLCVWK
jgi:hypothetical protein